MYLSRLRFFWIGIAVCTVITVICVFVLHRNYRERVGEWNVLAREAFVESLELEVQKRKGIAVVHITVNSPERQTLEEPIPDSVTMASKDGIKTFKIPREKYENSLIKETRKRRLLGIVLEKRPLSVDTLNMNWDSLLAQRHIEMSTRIRLSTTDWWEQTSAAYSKKEINTLQADSLLSYYMGARCEVEATGFVSYHWWQVIGCWQCVILQLSPWLCFCILFLFYNRLTLFLRRKFIKETTIIKEETVFEEKIIYMAEAEIEQAEVLKLPDGVIFNAVERTLMKGDVERDIPPQVAMLLRLLLQAEDFRMTTQ